MSHGAPRSFTTRDARCHKVIDLMRAWPRRAAPIDTARSYVARCQSFHGHFRRPTVGHAGEWGTGLTGRDAEDVMTDSRTVFGHSTQNSYYTCTCRANEKDEKRLRDGLDMWVGGDRCLVIMTGNLSRYAEPQHVRHWPRMRGKGQSMDL